MIVKARAEVQGKGNPYIGPVSYPPPPMTTVSKALGGAIVAVVKVVSFSLLLQCHYHCYSILVIITIIFVLISLLFAS